ncbi:FAD-dependent oxidoreductase [Pseudomaricurvus alkylphenolicus]|uniref:FAD-dependent oxidoreductase n=1 Tax=Pseudomaricurvus alkylphenolicus TaxID=1306991 RepID=UPI001423FBE7|nr:FAD-dependent oxidoreductase [Pseudomaricurvus alkylphenolicus]NIB44312.1 FAD-dependent oxidoreductase [Pseudomaricurvus alkylphenolicus]
MTDKPINLPFRIAIVGSGPSGFYAAEALLRSEPPIEVDVFEKLPVPYGLVRYGVAPDHHKLKQVTRVFERIAQMEGFRLIGNVCVGEDVTVDALRQCYHAVIFANGAEREKDLGIDGECLDGSFSAREFVAWYNGHPHYRDLDIDFSHETAAVIGQGNVALDVARILLKSEAELSSTDIADYALEALSQSKVKKVHIIGRRGPVQAKFTDKELREFKTLPGCDPLVREEEFVLNAASHKELEDSTDAKLSTNLEIMQGFEFQPSSDHQKQCWFRFLQSPSRLMGENRVEALQLERCALVGEPLHQIPVPTGQLSRIDCGLVIRCIGYRAKRIPGLPYDTDKGVLRNNQGRLTKAGESLPGLYAVGWIKRGSSGTIGTNRGDSVDTVKQLLSDLPQLPEPQHSRSHILDSLTRSGLRHTSFGDWQKIDIEEVRQGQSLGKPRQKITTLPEMISVLDS